MEPYTGDLDLLSRSPGAIRSKSRHSSRKRTTYARLLKFTPIIVLIKKLDGIAYG
jgi:hypothetical protein